MVSTFLFVIPRLCIAIGVAASAFNLLAIVLDREGAIEAKTHGQRAREIGALDLKVGCCGVCERVAKGKEEHSCALTEIRQVADLDGKGAVKVGAFLWKRRENWLHVARRSSSIRTNWSALSFFKFPNSVGTAPLMDVSTKTRKRSCSMRPIVVGN